MTEATVSVLEPILCSIPDGATFIARGQSFVYEAIADGKIKAVKSDGRTLLVVESLRQYAASLPEAKIKPTPKKLPKRLRAQKTGT
jgi:hypothetical protein